MTYDNGNEMIGGARKSVSALFDDRAEALRAVERLRASGISENNIRMVEGSAGGATAQRSPEGDKTFWDSLSDFFFPEEDRHAYAEGLSRGGYLVTVSGISTAHYDMALDILDDEGTVDLNEREASWRSEGWSGYEANPYGSSDITSGTTASLASNAPRADSQESIPVVEEQLSIGKRDTSHGRVRVRAYTVEEPVNETVELRDERVELERRPVNRAATDTDAAFQDRTIEAEEYAEEAVVAKEARVVEEIGLKKVSGTHTETISDTVRHTEVEVEDDRDGTMRRDATVPPRT
ncbi:DUF2382 domain-containing protein [Paracoccus sp. Ld10]|uniref:DUF2382 domain-containing protein n=1 Tax=Paracoccus sp. Ld10 TaxID=649158 RepID=UPI00386FDA1A